MAGLAAEPEGAGSRYSQPAGTDPEHQPRLAVRCLGAFQILENGQPLRFEGKVQRKPMALLKALIALGASDVPEDRLIDIVWPDSLEGSERKTLEVTLHRLRRLLGDSQAVQVSDRRVSLNRERVSVDLWALEQELALVVGCRTVSDAELEHAALTILDLNRGQFLHGEPDAAWLLPVRNRLNGRFQRFVMQLGDRRESERRWEHAAELYERAIELDPLAETFYGRLMVCLREQGREAEAIKVFRRCQQMLSVVLSVAPAENTQALYRGLLTAEEARGRRGVGECCDA